MVIEHIKIPLHGKHGEGKHTLTDGDYDGEYFSQYRWLLSTNGYVVRTGTYADGTKNRKLIYLHHEVCRPYGNMVFDHINRDKLDNRGSNLRLVTKAQNTYNRTRHDEYNKRPKGVSNNLNRYTLKDGTKKLSIGNKFIVTFDHKRIGSFETIDEASAAWDRIAYKKYGEFGVYNNIL